MPRFPVPDLAVPVLGIPVLGIPVLGIPVLGIPVLGIPVPGIPVPEGRAAKAATRRMGRSRERLTAAQRRSPGPARMAPARTAAAQMAATRMAATRMAATRAAARGVRRGTDRRGRRAAPEHRAATARGAGPHHAGDSSAVAPRRDEAAGPPGTGYVAGRPGSHRAGSLARQAGSRAGRDRAAERPRRVGRPRLVSSAPGMTWAAEAGDRPGSAVVPSRGPAQGPGTLRPDIRAEVERSPCGPRRAAPRSGCREMRRVVGREKRRPPSAAGRPREHPRRLAASWSLEGRRTRET